MERCSAQTTICGLEVLQLSLRNLYKLQTLLEMPVEEADNNENLQGGMQSRNPGAGLQEKGMRFENPVRGNWKNRFLQCSKPTLQHSSIITKQLGLEKDVVHVSFCNLRQKGKHMIKY